MNTLRLELTPQNLKRRIWLLVIETAQNLKLEEKKIIPPDKNIVVFHSNTDVLIQTAQFQYHRFEKRINAG